MAIAFGGVVTGITGGSAGAGTDHTSGNFTSANLTAGTITGSNTYALFGVSENGAGEVALSSATYDGVSLGTALGSVRAAFTRITVYGLAAPGSAKSFVANWSASGPQSVQLTVAYWTGVDQATPVRTAATAASTTNPATVDVTNSLANDVIAGVFGVDDTTAANGLTSGRVGAGQTFRATATNSTSEASIAVCDEPGASGTVTHSWDFVNDAGNGFAVVATPLIPVASGAAFIAAKPVLIKQAVFRAATR